MATSPTTRRFEEANPNSMFSDGWRDAWGNTFPHLVGLAKCGIVNSEPSAFFYNPDHFPPLAIKLAVKEVEEARRRKLSEYPVPQKQQERTLQ